jgi:hypothetical protein
MSELATIAEADYRRSYGHHVFESVRGDTMSVVSGATYEDFWSTLSSGNDLGRLALTPELMTAPITALDQLATQRDMIEDRVAQVRELSADTPVTTFALGTATFNNPGERPANSLLFIRSGEVVAQVNKSHSASAAEKAVFTMRPQGGRNWLSHQVAALVCSDILGEAPIMLGVSTVLARGSDNPVPARKVPDSATTVLLSSCWAVPLLNGSMVETVPPEDRFKTALEYHVGLLFACRPNLEEVLVADRTVIGSEVTAPYIGHFTRRDPVAAPSLAFGGRC